MAESLMYGDNPLGIVGGVAESTSFDDAHTTFSADNVQDAIEALNDSDNIKYDNTMSVSDAILDIRNKQLIKLDPIEVTVGGTTRTETWQEFLIRNIDILSSQYSAFRILQTVVQRSSSANISNIYFRCIRRVSSGVAKTAIWQADYYTASNDVPNAVYHYFISLSVTGEGVKNGAIRRCYIDSSGLGGATNFSTETAQSIYLLGPANGETFE